MRSHPAKYGEGFDAPPTLERSGSMDSLRYDAEYGSWYPDTCLSPLLLLQHHQSFDELSGCHPWIRTQPTTQGKQSLSSRRV